MWKYIGQGRSITGVPAEDLSDELFAAAEARLDGQFGVKGSLSTCQHAGQVDGEGRPAELEPGHACLVYQHVEDAPATPAKPEKKAAATAVESEG